VLPGAFTQVIMHSTRSYRCSSEDGIFSVFPAEDAVGASTGVTDWGVNPKT
jgi:hypothetical protein